MLARSSAINQNEFKATLILCLIEIYCVNLTGTPVAIRIAVFCLEALRYR